MPIYGLHPRAILQANLRVGPRCKSPDDDFALVLILPSLSDLQGVLNHRTRSEVHFLRWSWLP